ncbi:MAG: hypothetical protein ABI366_03575 [Ginsengibacter sp.]
MQTVTIDILNKKAIKLLKELEDLRLIHLRKEKGESGLINLATKYKGKMKKQPLKELRNAWE